jgi:long-chain acyl-CoA synthetase
MARFSIREVGKAAFGAPLMEPVRFHMKYAGRAFGAKTILGMLRPDRMAKLLTAGYRNLVPELLLAMARIHHDREAVISDDMRLTSSQFTERSLRLANWMISQGLMPKDRVATLAYNSHFSIETLFASSFAGCPNPGVNWHLKDDELVKTINITKPKILVAGPEFAEQVMRLAKELPSVKKILVAGSKIPKGAIPYDEAVSHPDASAPKGRFILGASPYTSGTTGIPKSVNLNDGLSLLFDETAAKPDADLAEYVRLLFAMLNGSFHLNLHKIKEPRSLVVTPLYHAGTIAGLLPMIFGGALVLMGRFDPENVLATIEKERISWAFLVPTMIRRILALPENVKNRYNLSSMKSLISAAAPCPASLKEQANEFFMERGASGPVLHEFYGSSETMMVSVLSPQDYRDNPKRLHSVGRPRCGDMVIVDPESGRQLAVGEQGAVCVRTISTLVLNYGSGSEDLLKGAFHKVDGKNYYNDGVVGYQDEDGFLYLTDRIKDMVISGGVNVFPGEVEKALMSHPAVADVAVFGIPDLDLGEVMRAEIQLAPGKTLTEEEAFLYCKEKGLYGFKLPKQIGFAEKLPRRDDGKLIKRELKEKFWKEA